MKQTFFILALFLILSGCKKECDAWHEGKKCDTEVRTQYVGRYFGTLISGGNSQNGYCDIAVNGTSAQYFLMDGNIDCALTSDGAFNIPLQSVTITGGQTAFIEGAGAFNNSTLNYHTNLNINGSSIFITFTGTK